MRRGPKLRQYQRAINAPRGLKKYQIAGAAATGLYSYMMGGKKQKKTKPSKTSQRKVYKKQKQLSKKVKELERLTEADIGTLTFRDREADRILSSVNSQAVSNYICVSSAAVEEVIAQLRYYDPTAPTALVTADGATGTYQKEFYFKTIFTQLHMANNYQVPADVSVYLCEAKVDTSINPATAWANGLTDSSNVANTDINIYPSDSDQLTDLYNVKRVFNRVLMPGRTASVKYSPKPFSYDPSFTDSHSQTYQKAFRGAVWLVVLRGVLGHDTTANEQGILGSGLDIEVKRTFVVKYPAGADIKYTYSTNGLSSFTNAGVISNKPVSDNQSYSVS